MKNATAIFFAAGAALLLLSATARAAAPSEESFRYAKLYIDDVAQADGTEVTKTTASWTVLRSDALDSIKQMEIGYSTSAEKVDIIEAYTTKRDGKRIDAAKDSFQVQVNGGRQGAAPAFSDQSTVTVVFPDVEVGDTVTAVYTKTILTPLFAKQFSDLYSFSKRILYDDVRVSLSAPLSLGVRVHNYGLKETANRKENGRQLWAWTYSNQAVDKKRAMPGAVVQIGDDPAVAFSTFPSYRAVAESYGAQARPKEAVTPQIQALADGITKGIAAPRDQAQALYNWEIANLTYAGNCIGVGAVVPRDLSFVLANKMGDCKDHATLLQALLAAKGIVATQALIGVNAIYQLPDPPLVEVINHVIDYVPTLNLFLDATSGMPFGSLPSDLYGKPVLLVDGYKDGTLMPPPPAGLKRTSVTGNVTIQPDGSAAGAVTMIIINPAVNSYEFQQSIANQTAASRQDSAENRLKNSGYQGTVEVLPGILDAKAMRYSYTINFKLRDYVHPSTPGAIDTAAPFSTEPVAGSLLKPLEWAAVDPARKRITEFRCGSIVADEFYSYTFPKAMNVLAVPNNVTAASSVQKYNSTYAMSGQTMTITRKLVDTTPGPTCAPVIEAEYEQLSTKALPDLKAQIVYK